MDLHDPLADLGALYAEAQEEHNRGDEFATVCMRLIERLAEVPITHQHQVEQLCEQLFQSDKMAATLEGQRDELHAEVERLRACAEAAPLTDGRTCRVSMDLTPDGRPCLIVTAPAHWDEAKLGGIIAGTLNLWEKTAQALADEAAGPVAPSGEKE